jgi:putative redox protein
MTAAETPAPKPPARVHVRWAGEHRFDAGRPGGPTLRLDASGETGQSPVDAVLSALAACTAVDVVDILAKRRTPLDALEVSVEGQRRTDGVPRRLTSVLLQYTLGGAGVERAHAERAVELAITKYCSVRDSLAADIAVEYAVTVNGEAGERRPATAPAPAGAA